MNTERPHLVVVNARVWSGRRLADVDAVAVAGGRVVATGRGDELRAWAGPAARVVDARGATLTPGLTDAHLHLLPWALSREQPDLHGTASRDEALARVRAALERDGPALLVGRGWDAAGWPAAPDRAALDTLAPEVPVMLHSHDFHTLWVNTAALRAAGVADDAPDPPGGRFERDASGALTGIVRETATRAFHELEAARGPALSERVLHAAAAALHARGVTAVHDFHRDAETMRWTRALARSRRLRVLQQIGPEQLDALLAAGVSSGTGDDWFRIGALKLFADGTLGSRTAAMLQPYDDVASTGMDVVPPAELNAFVARAFAGGIGVAIHAIGDRAVRHALDAIERGLAGARPVAVQPRIEHVQLLDPADLPRFSALGVAASMQPQHALTDAPAARRAWGARCDRSYPWRDLLESGARVAFGSDAPVEPPDAAAALAAACARHPAGAAEPFTPRQRVDLDAALAAFTAAPAAIAGAGALVGTLEPGAPADLVAWDRDLFAGEAVALGAARPALTVLGGEIVYESPAGAPTGAD